jgi:hypothetical protein
MATHNISTIPVTDTVSPSAYLLLIPTTGNASRVQTTKFVVQSDLDPIRNATAAATSAAAAASAAASAPITATGGNTSRTSAQHFGDTLNIRDFGAFEDNVRDDAPAFNAAVTALNALGGGQLQLNAKSYLIASAVTGIATPIEIVGRGWSESGIGFGGTWLRISGTGFVPFQVTNPNARGFSISDLGITQNHPTPGAGWTPTSYSPVVKLGNNPNVGLFGGAFFRNIFCCPVSSFLDAYGAGRVVLDGIYGQFFSFLARLDQQLDVSHFPGSIHAWPYWSSDTNVVRWQQDNTDLFILRRVDTIMANSIFCFGARSIFRFESSQPDTVFPGGISRNLQFGNVYADAVKWPIWTTSSVISTPAAAVDYLTSLQIANFVGQGQQWGVVTPMAGSTGILCEGPLQLQIGRAVLERFEDSVIRIPHTSATPARTIINIGALVANDYDTRSNGSPMIFASNIVAPGLPHRIDIGTRPVTTQKHTSPDYLNTGSNVIASIPTGDIQLIFGPASTFNGQTTSMTNAKTTLLIEPTDAIITSHSVILPPNPYDGMEVRIVFTQNVTSLTISAGATPVIGPPTSAAASLGCVFRFTQSTTAWARVG